MPVKIFFCYAREDEALLKKLKVHLRPLQRQGRIDVWYDRDISAGAEWEREIKEHLNTAQIILLLVSPDFMDSEYCYGIEMKRALERHARGEARVIPIILEHVYWEIESLSKLQALPTDKKPIVSASWHSQNEALEDVVKGISKAVEQLTTHHVPAPPIDVKETPQEAAKPSGITAPTQQVSNRAPFVSPPQPEKLTLLSPSNFPGTSTISGIRIEVADWVPQRDETYGWWGVAPVGQSPDKRVNWSQANDPLLLPLGWYDVYWQQDAEHQPLLLAAGVKVKEGELIPILATSGMRIIVADWVPQRDETFGWWGVALAGQSPDEPVHWSHSNDPLLLPPGRYDVYWKQDAEHQPLLLVSGIKLDDGQVAKVITSSGIQ